MAYTYDDWLKEQNKDSLSFKDAMKAGGTKEGQKMIKGNEAKVKGNGKGWQKDGGLLGKGGNVKTGSALSTAAKAASAIKLYFPRQKFNNKILPKGWCILWPSTVTHPHQASELKKGKKYTLASWTHPHSWNVNEIGGSIFNSNKE